MPIGPWHPLTVTDDTATGTRSFTWTHHDTGATCPPGCQLSTRIDRDPMRLSEDLDGQLAGEYRIHDQWPSGPVEHADGSPLGYGNLLADLEPLDLDPQLLDELVDIGNAARNRHYHQKACGCSEYPHSCAKGFAANVHDTDAFGIALGDVLAAYERLRNAS